ncbi:MAG: hypothetical protein ACTSXX_12445 [Candidatus Baldrarchaeia archaeon]
MERGPLPTLIDKFLHMMEKLMLQLDKIETDISENLPQIRDTEILAKTRNIIVRVGEVVKVLAKRSDDIHELRKTAGELASILAKDLDFLTSMDIIEKTSEGLKKISAKIIDSYLAYLINENVALQMLAYLREFVDPYLRNMLEMLLEIRNMLGSRPVRGLPLNDAINILRRAIPKGLPKRPPYEPKAVFEILDLTKIKDQEEIYEKIRIFLATHEKGLFVSHIDSAASEYLTKLIEDTKDMHIRSIKFNMTKDLLNNLFMVSFKRLHNV